MWEGGTTQKEEANKFASVNMSTGKKKKHSVLKRALTIINESLYLQLLIKRMYHEL